MRFVSEWVMVAATPRFLAEIMALCAGGTVFLLAVILVRRLYRSRYFRRRDECAVQVRRNWAKIVGGTIPPETWLSDALMAEVVEEMLLESIGAAGGQELTGLLECLQASGLLHRMIYQARRSKGWKQRNALIALGRSRSAEAIPILAEALDSDDLEMRIAGVRGLGRIASPKAASPILDRLLGKSFNVPVLPVKNALLSCCRPDPSFLISYVGSAQGEVRETLARVLAEIATPDLGNELVLLASDPSAELRASGARALAQAPPEFGIPLLVDLTMDEIWFVRLRAVVSLGTLHHPASIPALVRTLCDTNRMVRMRSAHALAEFTEEATEIVERIVSSEDRYALQAYVSELQRRSTFQTAITAINTRCPDPTRRMLLAAVKNAYDGLSQDAAPAENIVARP